MDITNVSESLKPKIIDLVKKEIDKKKEVIEKEKADLRDFEQYLNELTGQVEKQIDSIYSDIHSQREAIRRILDKEERLLITGEIYQEILDINSDLVSGNSRRDRITSVSASLSAMHPKELKRIENPKGQGYLYGKKEWFAEDGFPKEPFVEKAKEDGYRLRNPTKNEGRLTRKW